MKIWIFDSRYKFSNKSDSKNSFSRSRSIASDPGIMEIPGVVMKDLTFYMFVIFGGSKPLYFAYIWLIFWSLVVLKSSGRLVESFSIDFRPNPTAWFGAMSTFVILRFVCKCLRSKNLIFPVSLKDLEAMGMTAQQKDGGARGAPQAIGEAALAADLITASK